MKFQILGLFTSTHVLKLIGTTNAGKIFLWLKKKEVKYYSLMVKLSAINHKNWFMVTKKNFWSRISNCFLTSMRFLLGIALNKVWFRIAQSILSNRKWRLWPFIGFSWRYLTPSAGGKKNKICNIEYLNADYRARVQFISWSQYVEVTLPAVTMALAIFTFLTQLHNHCVV